MALKFLRLSMAPILCIALLISTQQVTAKPSITLSLYKNNGYGVGNDIGGIWTVNAQTSPDATHVKFYLDDALQIDDTAAPFSWQFDTASYAAGQHVIKADVFDSSGEYTSSQIERNFQTQSTDNISYSIIGLVGALIIITLAYIYRRRKQ